MTREQIEAKRAKLGQDIENLRKQAEQVEVAIRRAEGAYLQLGELLEEMDAPAEQSPNGQVSEAIPEAAESTK